MELVGDDDDGFSVRFHIPQHGKELVGLLGGQHGGGLIQNEDVGPPVKYLHDFHRLFFRHRHIVDFLVRGDVEAVAFADLAYLSGDGPLVELPFLG